MKIIKVKNDNIKLSDLKVLVRSPGLGKTYLDSIDKNYMDIDRLRSKYKHGKGDDYTVEDHEQDKGLSRRNSVKTDAEILNYSLKLIMKNMTSNIISLIAPNENIIEKLYELKIPYATVFIDPSIRIVMKNRLARRGNNKNFIDKMYGEKMTELYYKKDMQDKRPSYKIIFDKDEYISDLRDILRQKDCKPNTKNI